MKHTYILALLFILSIQSTVYAQLAKGDRTLAWQIDVSENDDYNMAFGFAEVACQESTHLSLTWSGLETDEGVFDPAFIAARLDVANLYFSATGVAVEMQIAVTNTTTKEVPADLAAVPFDDPVFIERFKIALDTIFVHIPDLELSALNIGNESDILFGIDGAQYEAYKTFLDSIVPYAKEAYFDLYAKDLKVGTTLTLEGLTNPAKSDLCHILNENLDIVAVTYYPLAPDFTMQSPEVVGEDFDALVEEYSEVEQPIYFAECGYSSSVTCNSSEELQAQFYSEVFTAWDKHYDNIKYLTIFKSTDWSLEDVEYFGEYYGIDDPIFLEYLRTLGVRTWDGDGENKLAYEFILCELNARDWCDVDCGLTEIETTSLADNMIQIYPNPASEQIQIQTEASINQITIFNSLGELILSTQATEIKVNTWPSGLYIVQLHLADHSVSTLKFQKH